jgi:hypothetical protein
MLLKVCLVEEGEEQEMSAREGDLWRVGGDGEIGSGVRGRNREWYKGAKCWIKDDEVYVVVLRQVVAELMATSCHVDNMGSSELEKGVYSTY